MWRFVVSSLVIHGLIVSVFVFWTYRHPKPVPELTEFEFLEKPSGKRATSPLQKMPSTLRNFVPKLGFGKLRTGPVVPNQIEESNDDDIRGFANQMNVKTQMETMYFYQAVWNKINEKVYFPLELADMYINGNVTVHIEVDQRGTFKGRLLKLQASDPLLQAFVLAVVIKGLKFPLPERYWHSSNSLIPLSLHFHFGFYQDGYKEEQGGLLKNYLRFERHVQKEPPVNKKIRDFFVEHKIPLLIPIPGGAILDIGQALQLIKSIGKPGPKALEQIQRNRLKEQFETTLKDVQGP